MCELREIIRHTVKNNNKEIQDSGVPNYRTSEDQVGTWVSFHVTEGDSLNYVCVWQEIFECPRICFVLFYTFISFIWNIYILVVNRQSNGVLLWCVNCNALNKFTGLCLRWQHQENRKSYCSCSTVKLLYRNLTAICAFFYQLAISSVYMHQKYIDKLIRKCEKYS